MKIIRLTVEELINIINNNEYIGMGSYGLVVKFNSDYLFKFNYKEFIECFKTDGNKISLVLENPAKIFKEIEIRKNINKFMNGKQEPLRVQNIKMLMAKQKYVTRTIFTQGLVYINDYCVGYLLKHHKNMINLFDYIKNNSVSIKEQQAILSNIKMAMLELLDNGIYLNDFTMRNMMYNPQTKEVQFIDFEDSLSCYPTKDKFSEELMLEKYERITKSFSKEEENIL